MSEITVHQGPFNSIRLHVEDHGGTGRPVVLLHGWPLSGAAWSGQVTALTAAGYRVITYDRRGFGRSDKPLTGYGYDTLTDDLEAIMTGLDLRDATIVGFSMGGGEASRFAARDGGDRVRSLVLASAVTPYLMKTPSNPDGPLAAAEAAAMAARLTANRDAFYDDFMTEFFSVDGRLLVSEQQRREALDLCHQASKAAALECMTAFGATDFRDDLAEIMLPTLIVHGDGDSIVPLEGSGARTHSAIAGSQLHVIEGAPHGCPISHADAWNKAVLAFLQR
ncbi:arylesterase [Pseudoclavibacter endophyticus]|uniref:Alpha/beta hydrolase n=1 Tax=Pseudoclavibacter endophyticus TaxID=1778590 RepID=A0A6H9WDS4_9MICO|nr:alpha/beta hydrolase [Pseudoclavibacter endophyticus]KAB1649089.1 alpha/beta hydrolase [Pseudoclavibacter endophyticus]GGA65546.1 arylesterase [Pseudoclavibacter endophyticus]